MSLRRISELHESCFEGNVPAVLATCSADGVPNVTWLSQVFRVDERHVALSCQFFRKTRENLEADPRAQLSLFEPHSCRQWRLDLRFARRETSGPVFDSIARRVRAGASLTQMEDVFALQSADIFEVMMLCPIEIAVTPTPPPVARPKPEPLDALAGIATGIGACRGLEALLQTGLSTVAQQLGLGTLSLYLADDGERSLYALASHGYPHSGVGARVAYGEGLVGAAAQQRMPVRIADMQREVRYGQVVREQVERVSGHVEREVPLPGLLDTRSLLAVPLLLDGELFGVLSSESTERLAFEERDALLLSTAGQLLAQAVARALERAREAAREDEQEPKPSGAVVSLVRAPGALRVRYYDADDSVFLDGEYLIKGLPGRILWLLLGLRQHEGRETFLNRELRLHPLLKLPSYRDNLEARLLMLQRRLTDKTPSLRLHREQRGRLRLTCDKHIELEQIAG